jgi:signal transduction histidine kinase
MNQYDKALECYEQYIGLKDSTEARTFYNELNTIHQQRKIDELQTQNQKMKLIASKSQLLNKELKGSLIILFLAVVILLLLFKVRRNDSIRSYEAQKKAEEASEMKTAFLANINHEIRTPLNAIVGFSQVLVEDVDPEQREQFTSIIRENNIALQQLISDVLDFSKIESNKMKLSYSDVELLPLMQEIYGNTVSLVPNKIAFKLEQSEDFTLHIDRMRLIQIMENLLDNAIKHTQQGAIHFGYKANENDVYFFVSDTGEGIPEDKLNTIFGRFTQLNKWSKGVGLGLAISKGLVTQFGGKIGVSSTIGKGSLFWFIIPTKQMTNL